MENSISEIKIYPKWNIRIPKSKYIRNLKAVSYAVAERFGAPVTAV